MKFTYDSISEMIESERYSSHPLVEENQVYYVGQGLYQAYRNIITGTGHNKYHLKLIEINKNHNTAKESWLETEDDFITDWYLTDHGEDNDPNERDCFYFRGCGYHSKHGRIYFEEHQFDEPNMIRILDKLYQIISITLEIDEKYIDNKVSSQDCGNNCITYCDFLSSKKEKREIFMNKSSINIKNLIDNYNEISSFNFFEQKPEEIIIYDPDEATICISIDWTDCKITKNFLIADNVELYNIGFHINNQLTGYYDSTIDQLEIEYINSESEKYFLVSNSNLSINYQARFFLPKKKIKKIPE